jgi:Anti-sigma-D factor RsdA to sigma factor binding region
MRSNGGESLADIAHTDLLLDLIGAERRAAPSDSADAALFALLEDWRDDVRWPPTELISERDAAAALRDGVNSMPAKRRYRGLTLVASIAAAVLAIGGFGAVVSGAGPGDPLYGLRTAFLGEPQTVRDDRVTLAAQTEMAEVQKLIDNGDWQQAQQKLTTVSTSVQSVDDTARKQNLIDQWNQLAVKVTQRDPAATLPPNALPGPLQQLPLPSLPALPSLPDNWPSLPATLPSLPDLHLPSNLPEFTLPSLPATMPSLPDLHLPSNLPSFTMPSLPATLPSFTMPSLPATLPSFTMPSLPSMSLPSLPQTAFESPPGAGSGNTPTSPTGSTGSTPSASATSVPTSELQSQTPRLATTPSAAVPPESVQTPAPSSAVLTTTTVPTEPRTRAPQSEQSSEGGQATRERQRAPEVVTTTMPQPVLQLPIPGMG